MRTDIKKEVAGRWASVLKSIGIDAKVFNGKRHDCLYCEDRHWARWDRAKEFYICNGCGHHQPIDIAIRHLGMSYKETANYLRPNLRNYTMSEAQAPDTKKNEERIKKIYAGLKRITPESIAALYLAKRGLSVLPEGNCYFHPGISYYNDGVKTGEYPAIVSVFRALDGVVSTLHITYLNADGTKADVEAPKKILPVMRPLQGSAIRLFKAEYQLAVCEGIETALAIWQDQNIPTWAAGNANNMAAMQIPESVKTVYIYADNDPSFTGQQAAYTLARRLSNEGKAVRVVNLIDGLPVDDFGVKKDYLDYLIDKRAA